MPAASCLSPPVERLGALLVFLWLSMFGDLWGMPANPLPFKEKQPDGTEIELRLNGNEHYHWLESDGYTVTHQSDGWYVYSELNDENTLVPTGIRVGKADPASEGLARGILPPPEKIAEQRLKTLPMSAPLPGEDGPSRIQPFGDISNVVILIRFANHTARTIPSPGDFDTIFNAVGGDPVLAPTGSVRDYYLEASYGAMQLNSTVFGWVTLPETEAYYADGNSGLSEVVREAIEDALVLADPLIDFSQFDKDSDGFVDSIAFVHSGYAAETGGTDAYGTPQSSRIWSHRWTIPTWKSAEGVRVRDYHINPGLWGTSGTSPGRIGVICHESGHFFGLPDLYDTSGAGSGIGSFGLMANSWGFDNSQQYPPHFSAWSKIQLGWITPTVISTPGVYSVPQAQTAGAVIYKITEGYPAGEYLLIENRQPVGYDQKIPAGIGGAGGLAIWHIDENKPANNDPGFPGQSGWPENGRHYKVALLQADGSYGLERRQNRGDSGDLYRGGFVDQIGPATVPNTDSYQGGVIYPSLISIKEISATDEVMSFRLHQGLAISSPLRVTGAPGVPFSYQIESTPEATSYSTGSRPSWLNFNPATGLLSGIPPAVGEFSVDITASNATDSDTATLVIAIKPVAELPFFEDFESGSLAEVWESTGTGPYQNIVTSLNGPRDNFHLTMDSATSPDYARNELTMRVNLALKQGVVLRFWAKEFLDEDHAPSSNPFTQGADFDGVAVSEDGIVWYEVQPLRSSDTQPISANWQEYVVDLDAAIASFGISYTPYFAIRFNHYDNFPIATDGFALDDISIESFASSTITLSSVSDTGRSSSDRVTAETRPIFTGLSDPSGFIEVFRNETLLIASGLAQPTGIWTLESGSDLPEGTHQIRARSNGGALSPPVEIVIDTTAPVAPATPSLTPVSDTGDSASDRITFDSQPEIIGQAETDALIEVLMDGLIAGTDIAGPTYVVTAFPAEGVREFNSRAIDLAGNVGPLSPSLFVTFDYTVPAAPGIPDLLPEDDTGDSNSDNVTSISTPAFTGSGSDGSTLRLFADGNLVGTTIVNGTTWNISNSDLLADGDYQLVARQFDTAGNSSTDSPTLLLSIDTEPPVRPLNYRLSAVSDLGISDSDGLTKDTTPTFEAVIEAGSELRLFRNGSQIATATGVGLVQATTSTLSNGSHTITARTYDPAGNFSFTVSAAIQIDSQPPLSVIGLRLSGGSDTGVSNSDRITSNNTPQLLGTSLFETGGTWLIIEESGVQLVQQAVNANWQTTLPPLADGERTLVARNSDAAGNLSPPVNLVLTIDTTAPPAPTLALDPASDTGVSDSDGVTTQASPLISGTAEPGEVFLFRDGNPIGSTVSDGTWSLQANDLPEGTTTFTARQSDLAGNEGPLGTLDILVDQTPPEAPSPPQLAPGNDTGGDTDDGLTRLSSPEFTGSSEPGLRIVLLDANDQAIGEGVGSPWSIALDPLPDGPHSITAIGFDAAGNASPRSAARAIEIDSQAPTVTINQAPSQSDPAIGDPIRFTALFSEPVTGFDDGDVSLTGPVTGGTTTVTEGDQPGRAYDIALSGLVGEGAVVATITAAAAMDAAGNPSVASTSTDDTVTRKEIPGPVGGVSATDGDFPDKVRITWVDSGATTYRVYRHPFLNPGAATEIASVGAGTAAFEDLTPPADLAHYYWVRAEDEDGVGSPGVPDTGFADSGVPTRRAMTPLGEVPGVEASPIAWAQSTGAGVFDGLLRDEGDELTILGAVSRLAISPTRAVSGALSLGARAGVIRGTLDAGGRLVAEIRQSDGSILSVDLQLTRGTDPPAGERLRGTIRWGALSVVADLPKAAYHPRNAPAPPERRGIFTLLLPKLPSWEATDPGGDGWGTAVISPGGAVLIKGVLGDGTPFSESGALSAEGEFTLYRWLYRPTTNERGFIGARLVFRDDQPDVSHLDGVAQWAKPADPREPRFPDGFSLELWALGSRYERQPRGQRALTNLTDQYHNAGLILSGTRAPDGGWMERAVTWMGNDRIAYYGPEKCAAQVIAADGRVAGYWQNGLPATRLAYTGVVFQAQQIVSGHFKSGATTGWLHVRASTDTPYPGSEDAGAWDRMELPPTPATPPDLSAINWIRDAAGAYLGATTGDGVSGGLLSLTVLPSGALSGQLEIDGERRVIRGVVNPDGSINLTASGAAGGNPWQVTLQLRHADTLISDGYHIDGSIHVDGTDHQLDAQRRPVYRLPDRSPHEGLYTLIMRAPDGVDPLVAPAGDGGGSLKIAFNGSATGLFALPDNTRTPLSGHVSRSGEWSLYRSLYGGRGRGYLAGKMTFRGQASDPTQIDGEWRWLKLSGVSPISYPGGVDSTRGMAGNRWTPPTRGIRALPGLDDSHANAWARFLGTGLGVEPFADFAVTWQDSNRVIYHGPERLIIVINPRNGLVSGSLRDVPQSINLPFQGVILPHQEIVGGAYQDGGRSGLFGIEKRTSP